MAASATAMTLLRPGAVESLVDVILRVPVAAIAITTAAAAAAAAVAVSLVHVVGGRRGSGGGMTAHLVVVAVIATRPRNAVRRKVRLWLTVTVTVTPTFGRAGQLRLLRVVRGRNPRP